MASKERNYSAASAASAASSTKIGSVPSARRSSGPASSAEDHLDTVEASLHFPRGLQVAYAADSSSAPGNPSRSTRSGSASTALPARAAVARTTARGLRSLLPCPSDASSSGPACDSATVICLRQGKSACPASFIRP